MESDLSLLMVDAQLSRDGTPLTLTGPTMAGTTFTYTIQFDSFRRNDSGNYTCTATARPQPASSYINANSTTSCTVRVTTGKIKVEYSIMYDREMLLQFNSVGVYISLSGQVYSNDSNILITDIGEGDDGALHCFTDLAECCHNHFTMSSDNKDLGEWFYPSGSVVEMDSAKDFYKNRGRNRVSLHRRKNVTSLTGHFCCEVLDATLTKVRICANVGELTMIMVQISTHIFIPTVPEDSPTSSPVTSPSEPTCRPSSPAISFPVIATGGEPAFILVVMTLIRNQMMQLKVCHLGHDKDRKKLTSIVTAVGVVFIGMIIAVIIIVIIVMVYLWR